MKVVSICMLNRSGSGFLHSLLDNHPNLIGFQDVMIMGLASWWEERTSFNHRSLTIEFLDSFAMIFDPYHNDPANTPPGLMPDMALNANFHCSGENSDQQIAVNKSRFYECMIKLRASDYRYTELAEFFLVIHEALAGAMNKNWSSIKAIVFGLHNPRARRAQFLKSSFIQENIIIHMVRNPIIGGCSVYKYYKKMNEKVNLKTIYDFVSRYWHPIVGFEHCSYGLRLEDLHAKPENVMRAVCRLIGVDWSPTCLQTTFLGVKWRNEKSSSLKGGFENSFNQIDNNETMPLVQQHALGTYFLFLYRNWGYAICPMRLSYCAYYTGFKPYSIEAENSIRFIQRLKYRVDLLRILFYNIYLRTICKRRPLNCNWYQ